jgi:hypothetical protein
MDPKNFRFGGGAQESQIQPFTLVLLIVSILLILFLPRKYAAVPYLFSSLLIPTGEVLVIGGLHLMVFRILIAAGWMRIIGAGMHFNSTKEGLKLNAIDRSVLWWTFACVITFTLRYLDVDAFVNRMGFACGALGTYFFIRYFARDTEDVDRLIKLLAVVCALVAAFMLFEQQTGRNLFSMFGGVEALTPIREGRLRSQGPFAHPIIAGTFGASLLPLFLSLWWAAKKAKGFAVLGLVSGAVMAVTSASATPLLAIATGFVALLLWPFRRKMRLVRWALVTVLVTLHLVMKAPVWALIGRLDIIGGSSGDHRYELVNRTILHFSDWWMLGVASTESWGYLMHDTANTFVDAAVTGGLLGFALFITILVACFRSTGRARKAAEGDPNLERRLWCWGTWLFGNIVAFFGIVYFDQSAVAWYALLAMVCTATLPVRIPGPSLDAVPCLRASRQESQAFEFSGRSGGSYE